MNNVLKKIKTAPLNEIVKPLFKANSLNLQIKRFVTDVDGVIISDASAPAVFKKEYPVYILGDFDRVGSRNLSRTTVMQPQQMFFVCTFVHGYNNPYLFASGYNTVNNNFKLGDIVDVYTDDINNPSGYVFILQTCQSGGWASIISNTEQHLHVKNISLQFNDFSQLSNDWQILDFFPSGIYQSHPLVLAEYRPPNYKLTDYIEVKIDFHLTRFKGINFLMTFECTSINFNFRIRE